MKTGVCLIFLLFFLGLPLLANQPGSAISLDEIFSFTIDGGGGTSGGGDYTLSGTIGQPDAGIHASGQYYHIGGFWGIAFTEARTGNSLVLY